MMNTSKRINDKIRILSFLCTVMVLFRHSRNLQAFFGTENVHSFTAFIENSISVFTEIAVPTFFTISGYFFFKYDYYKIGNYVTMIKKKLNTLVIPFFIWNIIGAIILLMYAPEKIGNSFVSCIQNLLMSEWNGPLWYVRDIIIIMLFVPIYEWVFKLNNRLLYLILFLFLFFRWWPIDSTILSTEGQLFFFIGGLIRNYKSILEYKVPTLIFIILLVIWCIYCFNLISIYDKNLHRINTIIGIIIFWRMVDALKGNVYRFIYSLSAYSFFIYVMHTYLIKLIKHSFVYFFSGNEIIALTTYFIVPVFSIIITLIIAKYWKMYSLKTYLIFTGGR